MDVYAVPTANRRYVQIDVEEEATTTRIRLTPDEARDLLANITAALDALPS